MHDNSEIKGGEVILCYSGLSYLPKLWPLVIFLSFSAVPSKQEILRVVATDLLFRAEVWREYSLRACEQHHTLRGKHKISRLWKKIVSRTSRAFWRENQHKSASTAEQGDSWLGWGSQVTFMEIRRINVARLNLVVSLENLTDKSMRNLKQISWKLNWKFDPLVQSGLVLLGSIKG